MKKIIILIVFVIPTLILNAQKFTEENYITELENLFKPVFKARPKVKSTFETFSEYWEIGKFSQWSTQIVDFSNTMYNKRLIAYPHFYNFIASLNVLADKNDKFGTWYDILQTLSGQKVKYLKGFLEFSHYLFSDSLVFGLPGIPKWKINTDNYHLVNSDNPAQIKLVLDQKTDIIKYREGVKDSLIIKDVSGALFIFDRALKIQEAKVTWEKFKKPADQEFLKLKNTDIHLASRVIKVNNAYYTNTKLNLSSIKGSAILGSSKFYPKFKSEKPVFFNGTLLDNIKIKGFLDVRGNKYQITSNSRTQAIVYKENKGNRQFVAISDGFDFKTDKYIKSQSAKFTFYLSNKDSLYHPQLVFDLEKGKYNDPLIPYYWFSRTNSDTNSNKNDIIKKLSGTRLVLTRGRDGLAGTPLYDSYHNLAIYFDRIFWLLNDSSMYFLTTFSASVPYTAFESLNFFDKKLYDFFAGENTDMINHLILIKSIYDTLSTGGAITVNYYRNVLYHKFGQALTIEQVRSTITKLYYSGFVNYFPEKQDFTPTQKLYDYIQYNNRLQKCNKIEDLSKRIRCKEKFKDFDNIILISQKGEDETKNTNYGINAILNINNDDLLIKNVHNFDLSPSVRIKSKEVVVKKNLNMELSGQMRAGLLVFNSNKMEYNYQNNSVRIKDKNAEISMMYWDTIPPDKPATMLENVFRNSNGVVYIGKPDDKSATFGLKEYPKYLSDQEPTLKFDKDTAKYGNSVTFIADRWNMDSLNYLTRKKLSFNGTVRTKLFKDLRVKISVSERKKGKDWISYLGFTKCTENSPDITEGYLKAKGGKFRGCLSMDDMGLWGKGIITYKSATLHSDKFHFIPNFIEAENVDTLKIALNGTNENIADVYGENLKFSWGKRMEFISKNNLTIYEKKLGDMLGKLNGTLYYTKDTMYAKGAFNFPDAQIIDNSRITLGKDYFKTDSCEFKLRSGKNDILKSQNLYGTVNLNQKKGVFFSRGETSKINFDLNNYVCIMDHFLWDIGNGIVNIGGNLDDPKQKMVTSLEELRKKKSEGQNVHLYGTIMTNIVDKLNFTAGQTVYHVDSTLLEASGVNVISVADAKIYPNGNKIFIEQGGNIRKIKGASVQIGYKFDSDSLRYGFTHSFNDATVKIFNHYYYEASFAKYTYNNQELSLFIEVENAPHTTIVKEKVNTEDLLSSAEEKNAGTLLLNPHFKIANTSVSIQADVKYPMFSGNVYLTPQDYDDNKNLVLKNNLISFPISNYQVNQAKVILPVEKQNISQIYWGKKIKKTLNLKADFFQPTAPAAKEKTLFRTSSKAIIYYNEKLGEYRLTPDTNMLFTRRTDTIDSWLVSFNDITNTFRTQGQFNFIMPWQFSQKEKNFNYKFIGTYIQPESNKKNFNGVLQLNLRLPDKVVQAIADFIDEYSTKPIYYENMSWNTRLEKQLNIFAGKDQIRALRNDIAENEMDYTLPPQLTNATFTFADLNFVYKPDTGLVSVGPIGIISIGNNKIGKYVNGYIKYSPLPNNKSNLIIYLEPTPNSYFGILYGPAQLNPKDAISISTSNEKIQKYLEGLKKREKEFSGLEIIYNEKNIFPNLINEYFKNKK